MPPRVILGVEYSAHLYQAHRLEHGILEAAIRKWLTYDLIADSEFALILFGLSHAHKYPFKRLDNSLDARPTLYSPPYDPFDEAPRTYSEQELAQLDITFAPSNANGQQQNANQIPSIVKATCSFARLLAEAQHLANQANKYDDQGLDLVLITSGLFLEDEQKLEELLKDFKQDAVRLQLIIYPSSMLFDTKSQAGFVVLDASQSEMIIRNRINKLLTIRRLTGADIHLIKEHLDANSDVRMSTLLQFYQVFQHISSGHSWDQSNSMIMLNQRQVLEPIRQAIVNNNEQNINQQQHRLQFEFQLDNSLQNELIVAFIDPKSRSNPSGSSKRFVLRNLQLHSPTGQLVLPNDPSAWSPQSNESSQSNSMSILSNQLVNLNENPLQLDVATSQHGTSGSLQEQLVADQEETARSTNTITDSLVFPYRAQLGLAGFHLKPGHLVSVFNTSRRSASSTGLWRLSATSEEPVQASAIAMARVNPQGDSLVANCWLQSYDRQPATSVEEKPISPSSPMSTRSHSNNKMVKVFVQLKGPAGHSLPQEIYSRMEVEDEAGNIVQNVNLLDDGLGVPDITRGDGIHSQYVQRVHGPGFYRVRVEVSGAGGGGAPASSGYRSKQAQSDGHKSQGGQFYSKTSTGTDWTWNSSSNAGRVSESGQDSPCCGSFIPVSPTKPGPDARFLSRQLYCGTFYLEPGAKLVPQHPPRVNTLSVAELDQDQRRVTIRWFEPQVDISQPLQQATFNNVFDNSLQSEPEPASSQEVSRYEIKLFTDREAAKRAFDARQDVGYSFNEWNVDGSFPNASSFGGQKNVTLRVPFAREATYYVAIKVYNNLGLSSPMSNIVQFRIRANQSQLNGENGADWLYGQPTNADSEGNVYDKNGELIQQRMQPWNTSTGSQLIASIEGLSMFVLLCLFAFLISLLCISLVACLVGTSWRSSKRKSSSSNANHKPAMILAASNGSSLASSSQCAGSQQSSELASSASVQSDPDEAGDHKLALDESNHIKMAIHDHGDPTLNNRLNPDHMMIQPWQQVEAGGGQVIISGEQLYQQQLHQQNQAQQQLIQHNMINGFAYATVNQSQTNSPNQNQQNGNLPYLIQPTSNMIQSGQLQSWTADVLLNHYDKVKQAHERNEAPPVMRVLESLDPNESEGLPIIEQDQEQHLATSLHNQSHLLFESSTNKQQQDPSYSIRRPASRASGPGGMGAGSKQLNQQLQQQLNTVLKTKRLSLSYANQQHNYNDPTHTSPALEGLTDSQSELGTPTIERLVIPPPPFNYYESKANGPGGLDSNGLMQAHGQTGMLMEPSIYSQLTNIQAVNQEQNNHNHNNNNPNNDPSQYYANQWQYSNSGAHQMSPPTNHNLNTDPRQYHPLEQQVNNSAISDV